MSNPEFLTMIITTKTGERYSMARKWDVSEGVECNEIARDLSGQDGIVSVMVAGH